jgi:aspartyl-tRNA(Asn)/glutamyl-tRNA(Gln) amidotransferase subunit C
MTKEVLLDLATDIYLTLDDDEAEEYVRQINAVLHRTQEYLPTFQGRPTHANCLSQNVFRADVVRPSLGKEAVLQNAPEVQDGHFLVPRILED